MDEPMTDAELRVVREHLGLAAEDVALLLGVALRTVRRWEAGDSPVPEGVREEVERWEQSTAAQVGQHVEAVSAMSDPAVVTYRSDGDYWRAQPQMEPWPARWHRAMVARVAHEVPGLVIRFA